MNKIFFNKRGGEKLLSIWWFLVLAIIGVGIVSGVLIYYSGDVDVREIEADILSEKILNCLNNEGYLISDFAKNDFNILKECELNENVIRNSGNFYFNISVYDEKNQDGFRKEIVDGSGTFEKDCAIEKALKEKKGEAKSFPKCVKKREYVLYYDNGLKKAVIEVLAGSNQGGKKTANSKL